MLKLLETVAAKAVNEIPSQIIDVVSMTLLEASLPILLARMFSPDHIRTVLDLLARASSNGLPALFILTLTILSLPSEQEMLSKSLMPTLESARTQILAIPLGASPISAEQVQLAFKCLNDLERQLDPVVSRKRKRGYVDSAALQPQSAELPILLGHIALSIDPEGSRHLLEGSLRARLAYERAHGIHDGGEAGWAGDLIAACVPQIDSGGSSSRTQARWRSLMYGVLPMKLRELGIDTAIVAKDQAETAKRWLREPTREVRTVSLVVCLIRADRADR